MRAFSWREWGILAVGFTFPFYTLWIVAFCFDPSFNTMSIIEGMSFHINKTHSFVKQDLPIVILLSILIIISSFTWIAEFKKRVIKGKKIFSVINCLFIFSLITLFLEFSFDFQSLSILSLPLTFLISNYYYNNENTIIKEFAFFLFFVVIVYSQVVLL